MEGYIINPIFQIKKLGLIVITAVTIFSYNYNLISPILTSGLSYFCLDFHAVSSIACKIETASRYPPCLAEFAMLRITT